MMAIETSRTTQPVTENPRGGAMGTWGLWLGIIVQLMFTAGLATAALYLETNQPAWPPEGIQVPGRGWAWLSVALAAAGSAGTTWALWRMRSGGRRLAALSLAWGGLAYTGSVVALAADLRAAGFRWDEHSYTSVYWSLTGFAITYLSIGAMMIAAVLVQTVTGVVDERRHLELSNTAMYVWVAFATSAGLLALVHYLPAVGGGG
jgi:heme/copper-type cytochrome/quinol oxidase subunit 3